MLAYFVWAVIYYVALFVNRRQLVQQNKIQTLFGYLMSQKGPVQSLCSKVSPALQPLTFLGLHLTFTLACMLLGTLCWFSFYFATLLLFFLCVVSAWNGGNFYFEVFAKRYEKKLQDALAQQK
mmetsp:Transcript_20565/g.44550  ORF Transcript_20565/g.44550 Transcript_20565/m.44550 type:complete len:123 (+) Transcript_20565:773-1141(+)